MVDLGKNSEALYIAKYPKSKALYAKAVDLFPNGVTHDGRFFKPFPLYITHAKGSRMWDVDGYEYIDYFGGHGALMLGHSHPSLLEAVKGRVEMGTHFGGSHGLEMELADLIKRLVPSAERVQYANSGTEAGIIAMRLARAFTGREKIVKFRTHFHGQSSPVMVGLARPWDMPFTGGLATCEYDATIVVPINDEEALENALSKKDVAVVMAEPSNPSTAFSFYPKMRALADKYGSLLLFDEVVSGFRFSPGGIQEIVGVLPDLTMLGKIVGGGMPAGALVGRREVMDMMAFKGPKMKPHERVRHTGTWNGNPLTCAAGIETLKQLSSGTLQKEVNAMTARLRAGWQEALDKRGIKGCVYGIFSLFNTYIGECPLQGECEREVCLNTDKVFPVDKNKTLITNLVLNGIRVSGRAGPCGLLSAAHTDQDIEETVDAFGSALDAMIREIGKE